MLSLALRGRLVDQMFHLAAFSQLGATPDTVQANSGFSSKGICGSRSLPTKGHSSDPGSL